MSNTSTVTPYDNTAFQDSVNALGTVVGIAAGACIGVAAAGVVTMARWLAQETEADREAVARLNEVRQRERLGTENRPGISGAQVDLSGVTTLHLHVKDSDSVLSTATALGYRAAPAQAGFGQADRAIILLQKPSGERLAITQNAHGRLAIHTAGDQMQIHALVRQHTEERALAHLRSKGMDVKNVRLANGELQILARESNAGESKSATEVKAQVRADGTAYVDIDKCRGNRCETLISELARAVGGRVSGTMKKEAYFQLPGEPTKTQVKA